MQTHACQTLTPHPFSSPLQLQPSAALQRRRGKKPAAVKAAQAFFSSLFLFSKKSEVRLVCCTTCRAQSVRGCAGRGPRPHPTLVVRRTVQQPPPPPPRLLVTVHRCLGMNGTFLLSGNSSHTDLTADWSVIDLEVFVLKWQ